VVVFGAPKYGDAPADGGHIYRKRDSAFARLKGGKEGGRSGLEGGPRS